MTTKKIPLVSVVMATYNRADILPRAIESILNQSFTDFEFIIVDDGSADDTQAVIKEYQKLDRRIISISQTNQSLAMARNHGVQKAQGKYICFIDDDDSSHPARIKEQFKFLQKNPQLDACICLISYLNENSQIYKKQKVASCSLPTTGLEDVPLPPFVLNATTMIIRSSFLSCKGYRVFFSLNQDYDLSLRFQEKSYQAACIPKYLYQSYRDYNRDSTTRKDFIRIMNMHLIAHISAWYRRNDKKDPSDENGAVGDILKLIPKLPPTARKYLIVYVKRCIYNIYHHAQNEQTKANIAHIRTIISYLQPGLKMNSRLIRTKLNLLILDTKVNRH